MDGHPRPGGDGLNKPLDSGLRRNDGEARVKAISLPECIYRFVVIPAKAGIQAGVAEVLNPSLAFKSRGAT